MRRSSGRQLLKKILLSDLFFASVLLVLFFAPFPSHATPVEATILVDSKSGSVLEAKNPDVITYPASLTKMMTLYLLFEELKQKKLKLSDTITITKNAAQKAATNLNLRGGEKITVETAILALVVRSANDIATAIAEKISGNEAAFASKMTKKARSLGMNKTRFYNASGLPDSRQVTTARDMAILGAALFQNFPGYYHYFSVDSFTYRGVTYAGHNRVTRNYEGADGIKTGFIRLSGFNLVTSAKRNNRRLIGVVLGGASSFARDQKMQAMLDRGFNGNSKSIGQTLIAKAPVIETTEPEIAATPASIQTAGQEGGTDEFDIVSQTIQRFQEQQAAAKNVNINPAPTEKPAKPVASAKKATTKVKTTVNLAQPSSEYYGIQVGAYNKYSPARAAALKAAKAIKRKQSNVVIDQAKSGSSSLFRARIAGLTKKQAEGACRTLKSKGTTCIVVPGLDTVANKN